MYSFLGSLNYYSRFIKELAIYASVLFELRETEFLKISRMCVGGTEITMKVKEYRDPTMGEGKERDPNERTRWEKDTITFTMLKAKLATV